MAPPKQMAGQSEATNTTCGAFDRGGTQSGWRLACISPRCSQLGVKMNRFSAFCNSFKGHNANAVHCTLSMAVMQRSGLQLDWIGAEIIMDNTRIRLAQGPSIHVSVGNLKRHLKNEEKLSDSNRPTAKLRPHSSRLLLASREMVPGIK